MEELLRCTACRDVIGTYEPLVAIEHGVARGTSLAREPGIAAASEHVLHRSCAEAGLGEFAGLSAAAAAGVPR